MKKILPFLILIVCIHQVSNVIAQVLLPPRNIEVNAVSLMANWQAPVSVVLDENFEGTIFPPVNWQMQSEGQGWFASGNGGSSGFLIPPHTRYAVANDHLAGINNNGIYDFLITPALDLSQYNGYVLSFNSFYTGDYGQVAAVELSFDDGLTWNCLFLLSASSSWENIKIDLSGFSGNVNYSSVKIGFHAEADDWGSGWAIDDVRISSEALNVAGYEFFISDSLILSTTGLSCQIPASFALFGDTVVAHVAAVYNQGSSLHDTAVFISQYLLPPTALEAYSACDQVNITWNPPTDSITGTIPDNLMYYNLYRNDELLTAVDKTSTEIGLTSAYPGSICYAISAVYDLTIYGVTGQSGESVKEGPVCIPVNFGFELPFAENWDGGQFELNRWIPASNWFINTQTGNNTPCASFQSNPILTAYGNSLESYFINSTTINTSFLYKIWLDFDVMLSDKTASASELLIVEIWDGITWITKHEFKNEGSFGWENQHIDITTRAKNRTFKIRFRAAGDNSSKINSWNIDNIHIFCDMLIGPPQNLSGNIVWPGRKVQLTWEPPAVAYSGSYILDDNTSESWVSVDGPGEEWIGNEFQYEGDGILQSVEIRMEGTEGVFHTIDVFDENKNLLGSSDFFIPDISGWNWVTVNLPDIVFSGTFYVMIHKHANTALKSVYLDQNGPNAAADAGRYYDGAAWWRLTDFDYLPSVCFVRAYGLIGDKKSVVAFNPGNGEKTFNSELCTKAELKSIKTASTVTSEKMTLKSVIIPDYYDIYRRNIELGVYPWIYGDTTNWIKIGSTTETDYFDPRDDLYFFGNMVNQYFVTAVYSDTITESSNIATVLIYEGINDWMADRILIFPNPANDFLTIEMSLKVESFSVFDIYGIKLGEYSVPDQSDFRLNVSTFPPGIFSLKFTTAKGESFNLKFVKM